VEAFSDAIVAGEAPHGGDFGLSFVKNASASMSLCCNAFIAVMQAAEYATPRDDGAPTRRTRKALSSWSPAR
jgi:hypothetical protein